MENYKLKTGNALTLPPSTCPDSKGPPCASCSHDDPSGTPLGQNARELPG